MKVFSLLALTITPFAAAIPAVDVVPRMQVDDKAPKINDPRFIGAVMNAHWYWRRIHCAQDLVWDQSLAEAALESVSACTKHPQHDRGGSNLSSVGPAPHDYEEWIRFASDAIHGWHEEETKYDYNKNGWQEPCGHFTQMVWRDSSRIGCALGHCSEDVEVPGRIYCFYNPAGNNIAGEEFKKNVWAPVCPDPTRVEADARHW